ncbi:MAG: glycosyltransferase family 2 protein, partial [Microthrixaceae bacterium]|nr:glycosyltransferase family 2 protein [Microthrixaceae bacterium]
IVNFDSAELIRHNVAQLAEQVPELVTIVVDNYSTAEARSAIRHLADTHGWTLVESDLNLGFGSGMNLGIDRAIELGSDAFVMLNPDATLSRMSLETVMSRLEEEPLSLLSPRIVRPDGSTWFDGGALDVYRGRTMSRPVNEGCSNEWPWLTGACLATTAEAWSVLGGFDDDYFLYWEDVDLSVRASRAGVTLEVLDDVFAVHDEGGTQDRGETDSAGARDFSADYYYYNIRNRLIFAAKVLDPSLRRRWYLATPRETYRILLRGVGKRAFLRPWRPLSYAIRGIWDGLRLGRTTRTSKP